MATNRDPAAEAVADAATRHPAAETPLDDPHAALERALVHDFLLERGYTQETLRRLPLVEYERVLRVATAHASLKLAEVESRAHLLDELK